REIQRQRRRYGGIFRGVYGRKTCPHDRVLAAPGALHQTALRTWGRRSPDSSSHLPSHGRSKRWVYRWSGDLASSRNCRRVHGRVPPWECRTGKCESEDPECVSVRVYCHPAQSRASYS
ncbi:unnamed protein product, partial [Pylaiella littoralis]